MKRTLIIAEAGVNHNGNLDIALEMIDEAANFGADYIKFQTMVPKELVSVNAKKAEYQITNTGTEERQIDMLNKLALSFDDFKVLKKHCEQKNIGFISTPFDLSSIRFLVQLNMPFWKIPSGEITNYPYLVEIASTKLPVIMSTGMSEISDIEAAVKVLQEHGTKDISLLHCNTEYPTPMCDVNLMAIQVLKKHFGFRTGYSDHTLGFEVPIAAVAMGAEIIEKHFTLNRNMEGPDHKASLEPNEFTSMVHAIRNIERAMGDGVKRVSDSEKKNIQIARKSIVANCTICKGELFSESNITTKRPGTGISPMEWTQIIGTSATRTYREDELIEK